MQLQLCSERGYQNNEEKTGGRHIDIILGDAGNCSGKAHACIKQKKGFHQGWKTYSVKG